MGSDAKSVPFDDDDTERGTAAHVAETLEWDREKLSILLDDAENLDREANDSPSSVGLLRWMDWEFTTTESAFAWIERNLATLGSARSSDAQ